jgi:hypothetical protein
VALFKRGYFSTCDAPLPGWTDNILNFFWVACKSWSNGLRSVLSFVGSILNKSQVCSL